MSNFDDAIQRDDCGVRFFCLIQGVDRVFIDGANFTSPDASAWSPPTSKTHAYTLQPNTLDLSGGMRDTGPQISRRTGQVQSGGLTVRLLDNRDEDLLSLFARDSSAGNAANITATITHDVGGGAATGVFSVDSTTGWGATGFLMFGRETVYYPVINGDDFGEVGNLCTRNVYDLADDSGDSHGDTAYTLNTNKLSGPALVTDYYRYWHGRWVSVYAVIVGPQGNAFDSGYLTGDYYAEIYRGIIKGTPRWDRTWGGVQLRTDSLESVLRSEVGRESIKGALVRFPGGQKMNNEASAGLSENEIEAHGAIYPFVVTDDCRYLDLVVEKYNAADFTADPDKVYQFTGDDRLSIATGLQHQEAVRDAVNQALNDAFDSPPIAPDITDVSIGLFKWGSNKNWCIRVDQPVGALPGWRITIQWQEKGSLGRLFGFDGTQAIQVPSGHFVGLMQASGAPVHAYVGPESTQIPIFYQFTEGVQPDTAPASGYARIGEQEIVYYASIADLSSTGAKGLYALTDCKRGQMGTAPVEHSVTVNPDWTSDAELVEVEFGVGFDGLSPIDAILQLAVSTGNASHHGAYDLLGESVSPEINPLHFDVAQLATVSAGLSTMQQSIMMFTAKSHKLSELAATWLQPFGLYLVARRSHSGAFQIGCVESLPPLESEADLAFTAADLDFDDPAVFQDGFNRIVNQLEVLPLWNNLEEKNDEKLRIICNDTDSQRIYGEKGKLKIKLRGYQLDTMTALPVVTVWAQHIFARFSFPYTILKIHTGRTGWLVTPGATVQLTIPGIPTIAGARGFSGDLAVVLQASHTYSASSRDTRGVGSELLLIVEPHIRNSTYSPAARVASAVVSPPSITLQANAYSVAPHADADYFDDGDEVYVVQNEGDWGTFVKRTLSAKSGNVFTVSSALGFAVTADTIMVPAEYDECQASQRAHVFIADNGTPPILNAVDTEHFGYS